MLNLTTRIWRNVSLLAATGLWLSGCVTNGKNFNSDTAWIKQGVTKRGDVQMVLGQPYSVGDNSGKQTWTYGYYRYKLVGKSMQKELKFTWNPDGTVSGYSFNSSFPDDFKLKGQSTQP